MYIDKLRKNGVILEVNCETDFVAKNNRFKELVSKLTKDFANVPQVEESPISDSIQKYMLNQDSIPKNNEHISEAITHLGEKIEIKKACFIKNHFHDPAICLVGYAHSTEGLNNYLDDVTFGKYGTIVALKQLPPIEETSERPIEQPIEESNVDREQTIDDLIESDDDEPLDFETAAKQICQHIIVAAPEKVRNDPVDEFVDHGEEETADEKSKLPKQNALVEQEFLHSNYDTVDDFLTVNRLEVVDFVRVKCGED